MNWYKTAKSCEQFESWKIENLSEDKLNVFLGARNTPSYIKLFNLEGESLAPETIEDAKRCLLRLWHPDVNSDNKEIANALCQVVNRAAKELLENPRSGFNEESDDFSFEQAPQDNRFVSLLYFRFNKIDATKVLSRPAEVNITLVIYPR